MHCINKQVVVPGTSEPAEGRGGDYPTMIEYTWGWGIVLMPHHIYITYAFVMRVENKIHIVHIAC